jgi:alpha-1,2-mannosyltransferase
LPRVLVVLFVAQTALLLKSPSFFPAYAAFVVPAGALVLAVASERVAGWLVDRGKVFQIAGVGALCAAFVISSGLLVPLSVGFHLPFPGRQLGEAVKHQRCVLSDTPITLIEMNVLSRDLRNGCTVWPDVTGYTYENKLDRGPRNKVILRYKNPAWHKVIIGYLTSGDAFIVGRRRGSGLNPATMRQLEQWPVLAKIDGFTIYARKP